MSQTHRPPRRTASDGDRRRRLLALGAGGLVLGVGATLVFAAWTDQERAQASFGAGTFGIQGSVNGGTTWADYTDTSAALTLTFAGGANTKLTPDVPVYTPWSIKLSTTSTTAGTLSGLSTTVSGQSTAPAAFADDSLDYTVYDVGAGTCDAAGVAGGATVFATGATNTGTDVAGTVSSPRSMTALGDVKNLCVVVTPNDDLVQSSSATVTWTVVAESGNPL